MQVIRPGYRLDADRAMSARRAYEEFVWGALIFGNAPKGFVGLASNPTITVAPAAPVGAQNGATNSPLWANKTQDQKMADLNTALAGVYVGSNTVEWADTALLPISRLLDIGSAARGPSSDTTTLKFLRESNAYTATTGKPLTILGLRGLETAGTGGTARIIAYRRDPTVLKAHVPMPHKFLDPMRAGAMMYEVPGIFRFGGLDVKRPGAMRYVDGV